MNNLAVKFLFSLKHPRVIVIGGRGQLLAAAAISHILKNRHKVIRLDRVKASALLFGDMLLLTPDFSAAPPQERSMLTNIMRADADLIVLITHIGEPSPDKDFFAGELKDAGHLPSLLKIMPGSGNLLYNADDEACLDVKRGSSAKTLSFGFVEDAELRATDIFITKSPSLGTNFKINYEGRIVPVWLKGLFGKENIYAALAAAAVGLLTDKNLVEISQALTGFKGMPGENRLLKGIHDALILDSSASASSFSMSEGLDILGKLEAQRKIAVLGDIIGIGKYAIEAHESIGERASGAADILFTVGPHAKFIAEGAKKHGLSEDKIYVFDDSNAAGLALREKTKTGDLILVDGSEEMKMKKIIEELEPA